MVRDHNRAGCLLNEQLQNLDNFCIINHSQVWTTTNKTAIDLSLIPVDIVPLTDWSIYQFASLEIQHHYSTERVSVPKEMAHKTRRLGILPRTHYDSYNKHSVDRYRHQRRQHNKSYTRCRRFIDTQVIRKKINNTILDDQHGN